MLRLCYRDLKGEKGITMAKGKRAEWEEDDNLLLLAGWRRDGLTIEQIARDKVGCNPVTIYDWINKSPKIANALKKSKEIVDREVESALFKQINGYYVDEFETTYRYDENGNKFPFEEKTKRKYVPPSNAAIFFALKNRLGYVDVPRSELDRMEQEARIAKLKESDEKQGAEIVIKGGEDYAE